MASRRLKRLTGSRRHIRSQAESSTERSASTSDRCKYTRTYTRESTKQIAPDKLTTHSCCGGCFGHPTKHCLAESDTETVDITSRRRHSRTSFRKLGRNVTRCANRSIDTALPIGGEPRRASVKHNHGADGIDCHIGRLYVQVEHPMGVPAIDSLQVPTRPTVNI